MTGTTADLYWERTSIFLPQDVLERLRPRDRTRELLDPLRSQDPFEARVARLLVLFAEAGVALSSVGVTGFVLASCHRVDSDIDLVLYETAAFDRARKLLPLMINNLFRSGQDW